MKVRLRGGTHASLTTESDGTKVAQISCVDARRFEISGGAIPGSFAVLGSELTSIIMAGVAGKLTADSNTIANAIVGYNLGANVLTEGKALLDLIGQIHKVTRQAHIENPKARVKIIMKDHWKGCGAQGFTSITSYLAKFKLHKLTTADILGLPNEILGYLFVNTVLSPIVAILSAGQVSLSASVIHSHME